MSSFTQKVLTGERVLVSGTDNDGATGKVVLDARQWNEITQVKAHAKAHDAYDKAVEDFFAPLIEAGELLDSTFGPAEPDPLTYIEVSPAVEAVQGRPAQRLRLTHDSQVLRALAEGQGDRLVWVDDSLEILETLPTATTTTAVDEDEDATSE